jgi:ABC-type antimicrobial peptide transport system permease subunit
MFIRYIGTDLDAYAKTFERFKVVEGQMVPKGRRGILLPRFQYEEQIKLKTARRLDKIKGSLENRSMSIATDAQLQRWVHENKTQAKEILLQLDAIKTATATERLQEYLKTDEKDLGKLLAMLLDTNDQNFTDRYKAFYDLVAPLLDLYRIRVGDMLTIKAFTRTGYIQSVSVKVWGIYEFKGLEKAALAGFINLMDLVSFRDLYGYLTAEKKEEWEKMRAATGVEDVARENAEDALFGEGREVIAEATPGVIDALEQVKGSGRALRQEDLVERVYPQDEIEKGVVLNAAVILKDPKRIRQTLADIEAAAARDQVEIKALSWQDAAGVLGQFVMMLRLVLYVAVLIIFVVALVIINNAMVMATLERVREIGTLRAIGTQRAFIWRMLAVETAVVGALFGGIGAAIGAGIVQLIRAVGIPATTDVMYVFFSGPRLFPFLSTTNLIGALVIVLVVSALSAFYPAWIGMRVAPVTAMSTDD